MLARGPVTLGHRVRNVSTSGTELTCERSACPEVEAPVQAHEPACWRPSYVGTAAEAARTSSQSAYRTDFPK
jgi:hypothetical protein